MRKQKILEFTLYHSLNVYFQEKNNHFFEICNRRDFDCDLLVQRRQLLCERLRAFLQRIQCERGCAQLAQLVEELRHTLDASRDSFVVWCEAKRRLSVNVSTIVAVFIIIYY